MLRFALAPPGPTAEKVLVAIPKHATNWTIAQRNRGMHRLLVPVEASLEAHDALRYIAEQLGSHVAAIHLLNVQRPLMAGDVTPLVDGRVVIGVRRAAGERILDAIGDMMVGSGIPLIKEVVFGARAETICRVAEQRECTGIVMAVRTGFWLAHLTGGSVAARVMRLATVPVTVINARAAAFAERRDRRMSPGSRDEVVKIREASVPIEVANATCKSIEPLDAVPS